jgi:hypothetical protein
METKKVNKNRLLIIFLILLSIYGCGPAHCIGTAIDAAENKNNLHKIALGQSITWVKNIMGNPYKTEAFSSSGNKQFFIWYYVTESMAPFRGLEDWNYTPIIFEKDILVGWGYTYMDIIRKQ